MDRYNSYNSGHLIALLTGLVLFCLSIPLQAGTLYKWIDDDGQVRYSDRMPANQKKKQHQQLSTQGVVLSTTEAAKSDEELAIQAEARRKQEEQAKKDAVINAEQNRVDNVLLLTFSNEDEIRQARDGRLEVLESVISLINKSIESTQTTLTELKASAEQSYTSNGKEIPGGLAQKIEHFSRKVQSRNVQLQQKEAEKSKINGQFEEDLARFRFLKSL